MTHDHLHHSPQPAGRDFGKAFAVGIALNLAYVAAEAFYGVVAGSLALIADAGHNLSDVLGLGIAWGASRLAMKAADEKFTYGFKKSSVWAAFLNAAILLAAVGVIIWEAVKRFAEPRPVEGTTLMIVAGAGVVVNALTAALFYPGRKEDLNIRGAFLHMAADAGISLGVVAVGFVLVLTPVYWIDPVVSITIALIIFRATWGLFKDSAALALDAVPKGIDRNGIEDYLRSLPGVKGFHDLHIWAMSTTETALTVHVVAEDGRDLNALIEKISGELRHRFHIVHSTIQIEAPRYGDCLQNQI